jgi:hypothetical protein
MKPYRRNWLIGVAMIICSALLLYVVELGIPNNFARFLLGTGLILSGWAGSIWIEQEKSPEKR